MKTPWYGSNLFGNLGWIWYYLYVCIAKSHVYLPPSHKCSPRRCRWQHPVWSASSWWRGRRGSMEDQLVAGGSDEDHQARGTALQGQPRGKPKPGLPPGEGGGTCFLSTGAPGFFRLSQLRRPGQSTGQDKPGTGWEGERGRGVEEITTKWPGTQMQVSKLGSLPSFFGSNLGDFWIC